MQTVEEVAQTLGMSSRQVRRRIDETRPLIAPYVRRGPKNRLFLELGAVKMLQSIEARRAQGATFRAAAEEVAVGVGGNHSGEQGQAAPAAELVNELRSRISSLEREIERLWGLVNERLPALPAPRPWWRRLLG